MKCFKDHCLSFVPFFLAIVLSVLFRLMASDCLLGIFNILLSGYSNELKNIFGSKLGVSTCVFALM